MSETQHAIWPVRPERDRQAEQERIAHLASLTTIPAEIRVARDHFVQVPEKLRRLLNTLDAVIEMQEAKAAPAAELTIRVAQFQRWQLIEHTDVYRALRMSFEQSRLDRALSVVPVFYRGYRVEVIR